MTAGVVCASGVELLMDYLEGAVPPDVRADLEVHVSGCPRCVAFLDSYRATGAIVRRATIAPVPAGLAESLRAFVDRHGRD